MRDYSSISPSAKSLMMMKGITDIPFVADAVKLAFPPATLPTVRKQLTNLTFLKRLVHFETRYNR